MFSKDLEANIKDILNDLPPEEKGLDIDQIYNLLRQRMGFVKMDILKRTLNDMKEDELLFTAPAPDYPNEPIYCLANNLRLRSNQLSFFKHLNFQSRTEVEREELEKRGLLLEEEREREKRSISVLLEIAEGHAQEEQVAKEIREMAVQFAQENPIDLLLEIAEWVVQDINILIEARTKIAQTDLEKLKRQTTEIEFRKKKATRFFHRLWRLDPQTESIDETGIIHIPSIAEMTRNHPKKIWMNKDKARQCLKERVWGNQIIEIIKIPENKHKTAVGTDASVADIQVKHREGSFISPTPATLFVASATMCIHSNDSILPYWDFDIDPRELDKYGDVKAAEEGLLISPRLRNESTDFRHLRSAAMELRQYKEELRVINKLAEWQPIGSIPELKHPPEISLLIRDGRLFPLVHRLEDYDGASAPDDILYGTIVRSEIAAFHDVFLKSAGLGKLGPIYSGVVKSPEFSWFSMIAFWYLNIKCKKGSPDGFYRPILNDQAVTHLLFWGLAEKNEQALNNPRNAFVTFRAVRRFSDIAFDGRPLVIPNENDPTVIRLVDEKNQDDWLDYIREHIQDANKRFNHHKRGVNALDINSYNPFLDLCYRAGVAMFYAVPVRMYKAVIQSHAHFLSPRWEFAVDMTSINQSNMSDRLESLFSWLTDEGRLVRDESHAVAGFEEAEKGLPLFIPDVVMEAHTTVVFTKKRHGVDLEEKLQKLINDIQKGNFPAMQP